MVIPANLPRIKFYMAYMSIIYVALLLNWVAKGGSASPLTNP